MSHPPAEPTTDDPANSTGSDGKLGMQPSSRIQGIKLQLAIARGKPHPKRKRPAPSLPPTPWDKPK
jgi:hypothetical protein